MEEMLKDIITLEKLVKKSGLALSIDYKASAIGDDTIRIYVWKDLNILYSSIDDFNIKELIEKVEQYSNQKYKIFDKQFDTIEEAEQAKEHLLKIGMECKIEVIK